MQLGEWQSCPNWLPASAGACEEGHRECCRASQASQDPVLRVLSQFPALLWTRACHPNRCRLQLLASGFREAQQSCFSAQQNFAEISVF